MNISAAIADPLLHEPSAGGLAPRTLTGDGHPLFAPVPVLGAGRAPPAEPVPRLRAPVSRRGWILRDEPS